MTTRRAFLAAAFGAVAARALPKPSAVSLFAVPTNITDSSGVLTYDMLLRGLDMLIAHRQPQGRIDFLRGDATYWLNKPLDWLPLDETRS